MNIRTKYGPNQWVYVINDFNGEHDGPVLPVKILSVKVVAKEDPEMGDPKVEYKVLVREEGGEKEEIYDQSELMDPEEAKKALRKLISEYITSKVRGCFPNFYYMVEESTVIHKDPDD